MHEKLRAISYSISTVMTKNEQNPGVIVPLIVVQHTCHDRAAILNRLKREFCEAPPGIKGT